MPDPSIALSTGTLDTATPVYAADATQRNNAAAAEDLIRKHYENLDTREQSRLKSTIVGAAQLKPFLDKDDTEGAFNFLMQRKNTLTQRMGSGENIDTQETDAAIDMLKTGRIDELKSSVEGLLYAGNLYGITPQDNQPATLKEWQAYNAMSPEDQKRYLQMKRSNTVVNTGDAQVIVDPTGDTKRTLDINPPPQDQPDFKYEQAKKTEAGKQQGALDASNTKKEFDAAANRNFLNEALRILPEATNGGGATVVKGAQQFVGVSTDASKTDRRLKILSAKLVGTVPRFEGPQGVLDVQLYQEAAGDLANTNLPSEDRMAAAEFMLDLLDKYGATGTDQQGQMVTIYDPQTGQEADIPAEDLAAALADGAVQR